MRSWIDEALALHAEGLDIVPIRKGEKRPVTLWRQWHKRRQTQAELHEIYDYFYSAEPPSWLEEDENGIHKGKPWLVNGNMRKRWPQPVELDWGVVTGNRSGIIGVDVDNEDAYDSAEAMQLTRTWRSAKSTRGYHFWFKHPGGTIKNAAKLADIDGLDIRADGGYIRVAPSKDMEWISECSLDELPLFPLVDEETPSQATMHFDLDLSDIDAASVRQTAEDFLKEKSGGLKIGQGNRNDLMAEVVGRLIDERADREWVTEQALVLLARSSWITSCTMPRGITISSALMRSRTASSRLQINCAPNPESAAACQASANLISLRSTWRTSHEQEQAPLCCRQHCRTL